MSTMRLVWLDVGEALTCTRVISLRFIYRLGQNLASPQYTSAGRKENDRMEGMMHGGIFTVISCTSCIRM